VAGQVVNSGARLDRLPISRFHWRILLLIAAGGFFDAFDIYLSGSVMAAMLKDGFSTLAQNAVFVSATFFGLLIGAALAGYVGDRFGRRYSYQANLAVFGLASLAACFAPDIETLTVLRFVMGVGLGAELVVAAGTLCEFIPPAFRGRWGALLGLLINVGLPAANAAGYFVIPGFGWRAMFAIAGVGAIFVWILRKQMPESPRWLESQGRKEEAEATLRKIEAEVEAQRGKLPPVAAVRNLEAPNAPIWMLFSRGMIGRLVVASLAHIAINVSVYGFIAWLPTFLVKQGLTVVQSLGFTTLMTLGSPFGAFIGFIFADRIPRKLGMLSACAAIVLFGLIYPRVSDPTLVTAVGFALVSACYFLVAIAFYGYVPELFPTSLRLRGCGLANSCGRAASIAMPYLVVFLFERFGVSGVLGVVVATLTILGIAVAILPVEMGAASLEEIEERAGGAEARLAAEKA
jgi:MFS transporter, putative metabolite:H+ symporter